MKDHLRFLASFIRHPIATGAVAPSSRHLADLMVDDMALDEADTVVELGPGTGSFTRAIEGRLKPEALFLALELNPMFAERLRHRFSRATVINDSAENLASQLEKHDRPHVDSVLCGLPWASFPSDLQERIMEAVIRTLRPGGRFATFGYVHASWFPTARRFHRWLESHFPRVRRTAVVWRNLPPAFVFRCEK